MAAGILSGMEGARGIRAWRWYALLLSPELPFQLNSAPQALLYRGKCRSGSRVAFLGLKRGLIGFHDRNYRCPGYVFHSINQYF